MFEEFELSLIFPVLKNSRPNFPGPKIRTRITPGLTFINPTRPGLELYPLNFKLIFARVCQTTSRVRACPGVDRAHGAGATRSAHDRLNAKHPTSFRPKDPIRRTFFQQAASRELPSIFGDGE
jgi:hypothetical protein